MDTNTRMEGGHLDRTVFVLSLYIQHSTFKNRQPCVTFSWRGYGINNMKVNGDECLLKEKKKLNYFCSLR